MGSNGALPTLTWSCRTEGDRLRIAYTISNPGPSSLIVYDGAPGDSREEWPDLTGQVYVSFHPPDEVQIKRVRAPVPSGKRIAQIRIPAVRVVPAGQSREVRFALPLPLVERSEYSPAFSGATWEPRKTRQVQLWVGYFHPGEKTKLVPLPGNPEIFRVEGQYGVQQFLTASADVQVEVRVRTDGSFDRV